MTQATLHIEIRKWPLKAPFHITGYSWEEVEALVVRVEQDGVAGWGEAAGVYYRGETVLSMAQQLEGVREVVESGLDRVAAQKILPPGGARNALDCALWDLEAKQTGLPVWRIAGLSEPRPLVTTFTCGADAPNAMATAAAAHAQARAIKLKLTGTPDDKDRVTSVRDRRPDVWLGVDANQGFTRSSLEKLMPTLIDARVSLIEQPFPIGEEAWLDGFASPIPVAADESMQNLSDLPAMEGRFSVVNIKLDKCGGLTEGLAIARAAREAGLDLMVGCMVATSLAMAPGYVLGQLCTVVDLDGPIALKSDRTPSSTYDKGLFSSPPSLWGNP